MLAQGGMQPRLGIGGASQPQGHVPLPGQHHARQQLTAPAAPPQAPGWGSVGIPSRTYSQAFRTPWDAVPDQLRPTSESFRAPACPRANASNIMAVPLSEPHSLQMRPRGARCGQGDCSSRQLHFGSGVMLSMPPALTLTSAAPPPVRPGLPHTQLPMTEPSEGNPETLKLWTLAQGLVRAPACPAQDHSMMASAQPLRFTAGGLFIMPSSPVLPPPSGPSSSACGTWSHSSERHRDKRHCSAGLEMSPLHGLISAQLQHLTGSDGGLVATSNSASSLHAARPGSKVTMCMPFFQPAPSQPPPSTLRTLEPAAAPSTQLPGFSAPQHDMAREVMREEASTVLASPANCPRQRSTQQAGSCSELPGLIADVCQGSGAPHVQPSHPRCSNPLQQSVMPQAAGHPQQAGGVSGCEQQPQQQPPDHLPRRVEAKPVLHQSPGLVPGRGTEQAPALPQQQLQPLASQLQQQQAQLLEHEMQHQPEVSSHQLPKHPQRQVRASGVFRGPLSSSTPPSNPSNSTPSTSGSPPSLSSRLQATLDHHPGQQQGVSVQMAQGPTAAHEIAGLSGQCCAVGGSADTNVGEAASHTASMMEMPAEHQARHTFHGCTVLSQTSQQPARSQALQQGGFMWPITQMMTGGKFVLHGSPLERPSPASGLRPAHNIEAATEAASGQSQAAGSRSEMEFAFGSAQPVGLTPNPAFGKRHAHEQPTHHANAGSHAGTQPPQDAGERFCVMRPLQQTPQLPSPQQAACGSLPDQEALNGHASDRLDRQCQGSACSMQQRSADMELVSDSEETRGSSQPADSQSGCDKLEDVRNRCPAPSPSAVSQSQVSRSGCASPSQADEAESDKGAPIDAEPSRQDADKQAFDSGSPMPAMPTLASSAISQEYAEPGCPFDETSGLRKSSSPRPAQDAAPLAGGIRTADQQDAMLDDRYRFSKRRQSRRMRPADSDSLEVRPAKRHRLAVLTDRSQEHASVHCQARRDDEKLRNGLPPTLHHDDDAVLADQHCENTFMAEGQAEGPESDPALVVPQSGVDTAGLGPPQDVNAPQEQSLQPPDGVACTSHAAADGATTGGTEAGRQQGDPARVSKQHAGRTVGASLAERASRHAGLAGLAALLMKQSYCRDWEQHRDSSHSSLARAEPGPHDPLSSAGDPRPNAPQLPLFGTSKVSLNSTCHVEDHTKSMQGALSLMS